MKKLLAIFLPVSLFAAQYWFSTQLGLNAVAPIYALFLVAYAVGAGLAALPFGKAVPMNQLKPSFDTFGRAFIALKIILTAYFFLIFLDYFLHNGYENVREYMTGDGVQSSPFYFAPFMYVDAYIVYPLNYIMLVAFYARKRWKYFVTLAIAIALHTMVFYASRMAFYNFIMLAIFGILHLRKPILRSLVVFAPVALLALLASTLLVFQRDSSLQNKDASAGDSISLSVVSYHIVPPLIFEAIINDSGYFKSNTGFGLATFGFLADPVISMVAGSADKEAMPSKALSAEAQNFKLSVDESEYNAFTTFLYAAVFDFGSVAGPVIYGLFFGFSITRAFKRRDAAGFLAFVILSYFVYFNSFTFFITGDWFWVFAFIAIFFRPAHKRQPLTAYRSLITAQ